MLTPKEQQALDLLRQELRAQIDREEELLEARDKFQRSLRHKEREELLSLYPAEYRHGRHSSDTLAGMGVGDMRRNLVGRYCEEIKLGDTQKHVVLLKEILRGLQGIENIEE